MKNAEAINRHYVQSDLCRRILDTLTKAGKDLDNLQPSDIATFEEFHTGGKRETLRLASLISIDTDHHLLDIGCGIGGPARTLTQEYGCKVTGVEITREFSLAARMLSERVGLSDRTGFEQADATDLPFENESFDIAWMQHVATNIEDKSALFAEVSRVLKPGGLFAFHEFMKGKSDAAPRYPVFWASESSLSYLATPDEYRAELSAYRFVEREWRDTTVRSIEWFSKVTRSQERGDPPPLGTQLIHGDNAPVKAANVLHNLKSGIITVVQAVFEKISE